MTVHDVLEEVLAENNIVVNDTTFELETIETIRLETGEMVYWVRNGEEKWLSIDPEAEEVVFFDMIEEFDEEGEVVMYAGDDYEFTVETSGSVVDEDEEVDRVTFKDFEGPEGRVLRVIEYVMSSEVTYALGRKIPEEQLQQA